MQLRHQHCTFNIYHEISHLGLRDELLPGGYDCIVDGLATELLGASSVMAALLLLRRHREATRRRLLIAEAAAAIAARNKAALTIQSVQRQRIVSLLVGPRAQLCVNGRTE